MIDPAQLSPAARSFRDSLTPAAQAAADKMFGDLRSIAVDGGMGPDALRSMTRKIALVSAAVFEIPEGSPVFDGMLALTNETAAFAATGRPKLGVVRPDDD